MVNREESEIEQIEVPEHDREYSVNLPAEKIYNLLLDYFSGIPEVKVSQQKEPSRIVVQIGSWSTIAPGNERGSMNIEIKEMGRKSLVTVSFNFLLPYIAYTIYWLFVWYILIFATSLVFPNIWRLALMYNNFLVFLTLIFVGLSVGYSVSKTKERFIFQLDLFFLKHGQRVSQERIDRSNPSQNR
jgi:hypothetical protein